MGSFGATEILIIIIPLLLLYFLPAIIAVSRKKSNRLAIILLNVFLGWTFIGWVAALIWSFTADSQNVVVNNYNTPQNNIPTNSFNKQFDSLKKLKELMDSGVLSASEFETQKAKLLQSEKSN
ncbi:MAG: superinfection immunity protein [Flavobacterium sp.]